MLLSRQYFVIEVKEKIIFFETLNENKLRFKNFEGILENNDLIKYFQFLSNSIATLSQTQRKEAKTYAYIKSEKNENAK